MSRLSARVTPSLLVSNLEETLAFYARLGFEVTGRQATEGGQWAEVRRDEVVLQFFTDPPEGIETTPVLSGTLYFYPESVDDLATEWEEIVAFAWGPETMPYGMREFAIEDPDGYFLAFSETA